MIPLSILEPTEVTIVIGIGLLVMGFEIVVEFCLPDEKKKSVAKSIGRALFIAGLAFLFQLTLENVHKLENIEKELVGVNEKATAFEFFKPYETIQNLDEKPTFQKLLKSQMEQTRNRLKQIEKGELNLSREEVIPVWEDLISKYSSSEIFATNVVSINDWEKFSPNQGLEAHEEFLSKPNSKFQRLFIYDSHDSLSKRGTLELANKQLEMAVKLNFGNRFQIKMINKNRIDNTTYGNIMYSNFGTLDIVVFDNQCLLQTITQYKNNAYEIVNGVVTNSKIKIEIANEMFKKLWEKAESIDRFKTINNLNARNSK